MAVECIVCGAHEAARDDKWWEIRQFASHEHAMGGWADGKLVGYACGWHHGMERMQHADNANNYMRMREADPTRAR